MAAEGKPNIVVRIRGTERLLVNDRGEVVGIARADDSVHVVGTATAWRSLFYDLRRRFHQQGYH